MPCPHQRASFCHCHNCGYCFLVRLPLEAIVHEETYHDYTPEDIDRLYAYKESLPENKQFIAENNKKTLAQVFTDVRYTKKDSEAMSENLWKVMKQQGF